MAYLLLWGIQILLLVLGIKRKRLAIFLSLLALTITSIALSTVLLGVYSTLARNTEGFFLYFGERFFSLCAIPLYGITLFISITLWLITHAKEKRTL